LRKADLAHVPRFPVDRVDYKTAAAYKSKLFGAAFKRFRQARSPDDFAAFRQAHDGWLEPFVTFVALRRHLKGRTWGDWPVRLRDRQERELVSVKAGLEDALERERFLQYIFYRQYLSLKRYCNDQGIQIAGDIPVYVAYDCADVWAHPDLFKLNRERKPRFVAGVPPDYFSRTGQLWGNPVYDWQYLEQTQFDWWMRRLKHNLLLFDFVRIDHFRGFVAYWEVPASHKTAIKGRWVQTPREAFFRELFRQIPFAPIFAEDLGYITADVREAVAKYDFPCMRVLHFAFDGDPVHNPHMPHNHVENSIVYTGTHDNNTTRGWFAEETKGPRRKRLLRYLGRKVSADEISWELMRLAMASVARLAVVPMQDVLGLGAEARMNFPAKSKGNWLWRMGPGQANARLAGKLREMAETYGRA
jgi:4-alpha-glucanotransferase